MSLRGRKREREIESEGGERKKERKKVSFLNKQERMIAEQFQI